MNRFSLRVVEHSEPQKNNNMKKIITYITVITSAFALSTTAAEAQTRSHKGHVPAKVHQSSNYITVLKKVFSHYDRHGHAIYSNRKVIVRKSNYHNHQPKKVYRTVSYNKAKTHRR